jgi:hypothetical protein
MAGQRPAPHLTAAAGLGGEGCRPFKLERGRGSEDGGTQGNLEDGALKAHPISGRCPLVTTTCSPMFPPTNTLTPPLSPGLGCPVEMGQCSV